jgi:para-nitrobenzyl esterase
VDIHGGGFTGGSANPGSVSALIKAGAFPSALVVTPQYRLGVFGFFNPRAGDAAPPNAGILDQQKALQWVSRNIAAFGGDPGRVMIAGCRCVGEARATRFP